MNFDNNIHLENDRARLEPLDLIHLDHLLPIALNHPGLLQYSPSPFGTTDKLMEYIESALNARIRGERYPFVIFDKRNNLYAGSTSYGHVSESDQRLEIGWTWLDKSAQGTGLNKYCKHLLLQYAFEDLKFERVEFRIHSENMQSRKSVENIGAQFEGELRSHTVMPDGQRRNTAYYSILKQEWIQINETIFKGI